MFRPLMSACGSTLAVVLVVAGLSAPATPAHAAKPPAAPPPSAATWAPPATADDRAYETQNVPGGPVPEGPTRTFQSDGSQARIAPSGTPVGAPGLGALPYFGFEEYSLSSNMVARVNLANGNLLLTANDGTLSGPGPSLRNDRFYNGLSSNSGAFGGGWSSSLFEQDVRLKISASTITYVGANGFEATFTKNATGWVAPSGFNATLVQHAPTGDPYKEYLAVYSLTFNKTGERTEFSEDGWILGQYNRNSVGSKWNYPEVYDDEQGEVSVTNAAGRGFDLTRERDWITAITDSANRTVYYDRDAEGGPVTKVRGLAGYWEEYTYDAKGRISAIRFSSSTNGVTPRAYFYYDPSNRVSGIGQEQVEASGSSWTYTEFTYASGETQVSDSESDVSTFKIDPQGRVLSSKDPLNRTRSSTWTANSDVRTSTDAFANGSTPGNSTTYAYDELGNQTTVTLPTGAAAAALYATGTNCTGGGGTAYQVKCATSDTGAKTANTYDSAGNLLTQKDTTAGGTGAVSQTNTYQGTNGVTCGGLKGQICSTSDGNNRLTTYTYDTKGNVLKVTPPAPMGVTNYTYDALGRVTAVVDGNQQRTAYAYDERDQLVRTTWSDASTLTTTYSSGLKTKEVDSVSGQRNFRYDYRGLITYEDAPGAGITTYSYDASGNMTTSVTPSGTVNYGYDEANQLILVREPGATAASCAVAVPAAGSGCIKFAYDNNGAETRRVFPGGAAVSTTLDKGGRPTRITGKNASNVAVSDVGYSYSVDGTNSLASDRSAVQRRTSFLEVGVPAAAVTTYKYDSLNRVTSAVEQSGSATTASWLYAYDKAGNRTSQTRAGSTGAVAGTTSYTYNAANQLTTHTGAGATYLYDAVGNQTRNGATGQVTTYNARQAVTKINTSAYQSLGQGNSTTLSRTNPSATFGTTSQGLTTESVSAGTTAFTRTPTGELLSARSPGSSTSYYISDALGSVIGLFDKSGNHKGGYSYSPYGETRSMTDEVSVKSNPMRYISGYFDSSAGLYKLGARYYDAAQGRFTQFDPSGQEANPYAYGNGDPVNNLDPSGLNAYTFFDVVSLLISAFASGAEIGRNPDAQQIATSITSFGVGLVSGAICAGIAAPLAATLVGALGSAALCLVVSEAVSRFTTSGRLW